MIHCAHWVLSFSSIDVDLPIECDDEYWINSDPDLAFKQPEGKPSRLTYFNCMLKLTQIHAFAMKTVVSYIVTSRVTFV